MPLMRRRDLLLRSTSALWTAALATTGSAAWAAWANAGAELARLLAQYSDEGLTLEHRKALSAQLDAARTNARRAATRAKERAGFVPVAARVAYQVAGVRREGNDEQKVEALRRYWGSAQWSELAEHLATPSK